jgi:putative nucleotidyltransferase with HDIG domain
MYAALCEAARLADLALLEQGGDDGIPPLLRLIEYADEADRPTPGHVHRVAALSEMLALEVGWTPIAAKTLRTAATLHDIGKTGLPPEMLTADRRLTAVERSRMELHTLLGAAMFARSRSSVLRTAHLVALHHHERWDGGGYPSRLRADRIPLAARIVALADVYDALASDRPYPRALPPDEVVAHLVSEAGTHFDPQIAAAFLRLPDVRPAARVAA